MSWPAVFLSLAAAVAAANAGEIPTAPPTSETPASVERAIGAVYPALVQIYVLSLHHDGGRERKYQASGSGVVISADGHVITNHHVAGNAAAIRCVLSTREELEARLVGSDALTDICVIQLDLAARAAGAPPLTVARFGSSEHLKVGETVLAMGCPLALSQSVTSGIVSNKDMMIPRRQSLTLDGEDVGTLVKWLGHDARIFPGNSGGPLVDLRGQIVGINEIGMGLGGAIPADVARSVADELIAHGKVRRAWTGASFQPQLKSQMVGPASVPAGRDAGPTEAGVLVSGTLPGSPAERAGLQPGDTVLAVDGQAVRVQFHEELPAFLKLVMSKPVGAAIVLKVRRAGKEGAPPEVARASPPAELEISLIPELRDQANGNEVEARDWGLTVRRLTATDALRMQRQGTRGVLVGSVRPGGPANKAAPAIEAGDVIVEVAGQPVPDVASFLKAGADLADGKLEPVPAIVAYDRAAARFLTVVEVGIRPPPQPPAEAKRAWLPVATQVLSTKLAAALGLKGTKGVRITQTYPDASAELQVGDILTHLDGQPIEASEPHDAEVFDTMVRAYKPGSQVELTLLRGGKKSRVGVLLAGAPLPERALKVYDDLAFEFRARDLSYADRLRQRWNADVSGALVTDVDPGGWAAVGQLRSGDLVQAVDGQRVNEMKDLERLLKAVRETRPRQVALFVKRGIETLFVEIEPSWPEKR